MTIEDLGYNAGIEKLRKANNLDGFEIGRVVAEHKERYIVRNGSGEFEAEITGNLRFSAKSREDFPAVGDWVAFINYDQAFAIIHSVLPRQSILSRQAVGRQSERQIIAANIDVALLVQAVDRDFNINRLERYLTISYESKIKPVIVLTKTDLIEAQKLRQKSDSIGQRIKDVPVISISNETLNGIEGLKKFIEKGKTYCLLGSSGVGKSSLMNNLSGRNIMKTNSISESTQKGRHITSHRELIVLENGGILIDNPGMREIGITDAGEGMENTFEQIYQLAADCKFKDCTHANEVDCAVIDAVEQGEVDQKTYENFLKMEREKDHFDLSLAEKREKEKSFGKRLKNFKSDMQKISAKYKKRYK